MLRMLRSCACLVLAAKPVLCVELCSSYRQNEMVCSVTTLILLLLPPPFLLSILSAAELTGVVLCSFLIRDSDSRLSAREALAVQQWIASGVCLCVSLCVHCVMLLCRSQVSHHARPSCAQRLAHERRCALCLWFCVTCFAACPFGAVCESCSYVISISLFVGRSAILHFSCSCDRFAANRRIVGGHGDVVAAHRGANESVPAV